MTMTVTIIILMITIAIIIIGLHVALDVQDRAGARKIQHAEILIRECADDL